MLRGPQANALPLLGFLDVFVFDLHGIHDLLKIGRWPLDEDAVSHCHWRFQFDDGDADFREEMRYVADLDYFFVTQLLQPQQAVWCFEHKKLVQDNYSPSS